MAGQVRVYLVKGLALCTAFMLLYLNVHAGQDIPDSLQAMLNGATTDSARIRAHIGIANTLTKTNYKKALEHATLAVGLSEKTGDQSAMIESYKLAGGVSMYKGLFDLAVNFFNEHYDLAKKVSDEVEAGMAYHNLGAVYLTMEDYGKAKKYFNASYAMLQAGYQKTGNILPVTTELTYRMNMAIIHMYQREFQRSDSMLDLSISMVKDVPDNEEKLMTIHNIRALLHLKTNNPSKVFESLKQSRIIAIRLGNIPAVASILISEGQAYEQLNNIELAKKSYTEAIGYADHYNGLSDLFLISEYLYRIYRKTGPSDSLVKYVELFTNLGQQLKVQQAKEELMRTEFKRSYSQMVEDWEHQQQGAKRQHLFLTITLVLASTAAMATFIRFRTRNRKMRFERVRRDLEERKSKFEQLRLQAELDQRDAELETIRAELNKQSIIEGLVGGLDPVKPTPDIQSLGKTQLGIASASDRKAKAWEEFEYRFQLLHSGFYDRLNQRFPGLTINERRLSAFLKLDMTTKEISDITGQSIRAVHMGRIRLRNKLGLTHTEKELFDFLSEL